MDGLTGDQASSSKQQASIRHQAASIKHQAASIKKLGSKTLARELINLVFADSQFLKRKLILRRCGCIRANSQTNLWVGLAGVQASSSKQQASIRHQAASIKHQAASIKKLGSETLARN